MARARNIKPGFFKNELLAEVDFQTRLMFIGLWTLADKAGRLEDRPKRIKIELFPGDDLDVSSMLHALTVHGFITRYAVKGTRYIQIDNFLKHQRPHHKEQESSLPPVSKTDKAEEKSSEETTGCASMNDPRSMDDSSTVQEEPKKELLAPLIPDPLIPDTGYLIPDTSELPCASDAARLDDHGKSTDLYSEDFNRFWKAYPSKKNKRTAALKFKKLREKKSTPEFLAFLIEDIECRAKGHEWLKNNGEFIPHAATYLNQERWNDPAPNVSAIQSRHTGFADRDYSEGLIEGVADNAANF